MVLVVEEDVKRVDAAIFELRNVHPVDDGRRACRTELPEQSPDVVIAGRGSHRREFDYLWRPSTGRLALPDLPHHRVHIGVVRRPRSSADYRGELHGRRYPPGGLPGN